MRDRLITGALVALIALGIMFGAPTTPGQDSAHTVTTEGR